MKTAIHRHVDAARAGELPRVVARMTSGWAVMGEKLILPGYCLLLPDPVVASPNAMSTEARRAFFDDLVVLGDAVLEATGAARINYEILGNVEPALHAHVFPRYVDEPEALRLKAVWLHDWDAARPFDAEQDAEMMRRIASALDALR